MMLASQGLADAANYPETEVSEGPRPLQNKAPCGCNLANQLNMMNTIKSSSSDIL
jgi:hypothetical protein